MQPSRHAGRTLFAVVVLLLVTLLTAQGAYAQAERQNRSAAAASEPSSPGTPTAAPRSGVQEEDCRPRRIPRHASRIPVAPPPPARMCDCEPWTGWETAPVSSTNVRKAELGRGTRLPLLLQTLRC